MIITAEEARLLKHTEKDRIVQEALDAIGQSIRSAALVVNNILYALSPTQVIYGEDIIIELEKLGYKIFRVDEYSNSTSTKLRIYWTDEK
jgi:hypothetical protein